MRNSECAAGRRFRAAASLVSAVVLMVLMVLMQMIAPSSATSDSERAELQMQVKDMFQHAYNSYMRHAFPKDELLPLSCSGAETMGSYCLTLIDSLDSLLVLGFEDEFAKSIEWIEENVDFNIDVNVSVFETNIRIVGGLLSAHLLAGGAPDRFPNYSGKLLVLAEDLVQRLMPAFETETGIPFGTVNLRYGVPEKETPIASLAGAGTLILEFGLLTRLTGNSEYEAAAHRALMALWERRSSLSLLGGHVNTTSGQWTDLTSHIGAGSDSFFEYLLKGALFFNNAVYYSMFEEAYEAIMAFVAHQGWYLYSEMTTGKLLLPYFDALSAFWPAVQVLHGDLPSALEAILGFLKVWLTFGFTPEKANIISAAIVDGQRSYPLRPELIESLYYLYRATKNPYYLRAGEVILNALQNRTRVPCGFAGVKDVESGELEDHMNSFFLAETLKYLYLLFDDGSNFVHSGDSNYIFNTEGHILPIREEFFDTDSPPLGYQELRTCLKLDQITMLTFPEVDLQITPAPRPPKPSATPAVVKLSNVHVNSAASSSQAAPAQYMYIQLPGASSASSEEVAEERKRWLDQIVNSPAMLTLMRQLNPNIQQSSLSHLLRSMQQGDQSQAAGTNDDPGTIQVKTGNGDNIIEIIFEKDITRLMSGDLHEPNEASFASIIDISDGETEYTHQADLADYHASSVEEEEEAVFEEENEVAKEDTSSEKVREEHEEEVELVMETEGLKGSLEYQRMKYIAERLRREANVHSSNDDGASPAEGDKIVIISGKSVQVVELRPRAPAAQREPDAKSKNEDTQPQKLCISTEGRLIIGEGCPHPHQDDEDADQEETDQPIQDQLMETQREEQAHENKNEGSKKGEDERIEENKQAERHAIPAHMHIAR